jgi:hypothetical protein
MAIGLIPSLATPDKPYAVGIKINRSAVGQDQPYFTSIWRQES